MLAYTSSVLSELAHGALLVWTAFFNDSQRLQNLHACWFCDDEFVQVGQYPQMTGTEYSQDAEVQQSLCRRDMHILPLVSIDQGWQDHTFCSPRSTSKPRSSGFVQLQEDCVRQLVRFPAAVWRPIAWASFKIRDG